MKSKKQPNAQEFKCLRCEEQVVAQCGCCDDCKTKLTVAFVRGCRELIRKGIYRPIWVNVAKKHQRGWFMRRMDA